MRPGARKPRPKPSLTEAADTAAATSDQDAILALVADLARLAADLYAEGKLDDFDEEP